MKYCSVVDAASCRVADEHEMFLSVATFFFAHELIPTRQVIVPYRNNFSSTKGGGV